LHIKRSTNFCDTAADDDDDDDDTHIMLEETRLEAAVISFVRNHVSEHRL